MVIAFTFNKDKAIALFLKLFIHMKFKNLSYQKIKSKIKYRRKFKLQKCVLFEGTTCFLLSSIINKVVFYLNVCKYVIY